MDINESQNCLAIVSAAAKTTREWIYVGRLITLLDSMVTFLFGHSILEASPLYSYQSFEVALLHASARLSS